MSAEAFSSNYKTGVEQGSQQPVSQWYVTYSLVSPSNIAGRQNIRMPHVMAIPGFFRHATRSKRRSYGKAG